MFFKIKAEEVICPGIFDGNYHHQEVKKWSDITFVIFVAFLYFCHEFSLTIIYAEPQEFEKYSKRLTLVPFSPWRPSGPLVPAGPW